MRVLITYLNTGSGNVVYFQNLRHALADRVGIECEVVELPKSGELAEWLNAPRLRKHGLQKGDVVVTNLELASTLGKLGLRVIGVAYHDPADPILLPHLDGLRRLYYRRWLGRQFRKGLAQVERIVAISQYTAERLRSNHFNMVGEKMRVIQTSVDTNYFTPLQSKRSPAKPYRLLFVGNASTRKGFDLLGPVMRQLGPDYELSLTAGLREEESDLMNQPNVKSLGRLSRDDLREAYRSSDALLFPSRLEGFGYAAVEAMACGCAVVGVAASTLPEITPPMGKRYLADKHDTKLIAEKVRLLFTEQPDGAEYRRWVEENFSMERWANEFAQLLKEMA